MVLEKLDSYIQNSEIGPLSYAIHRNKSQMFKVLNVRPETMKLQKEHIDSKVLDVGLNSIFMDMSPQARETK